MARLTFEDMVSIDLVNKQVEAAAAWVANQMRDEFGFRLNYRMSSEFGFDSPLEAVFEFWWMAARAVGHITRIYALDHQKTVTVGNKKYRLDFHVREDEFPPFDWAKYGAQAPRVCVELDGHDFHERTKEQVTYRNQRDRDLQADGWLVLHYSGSELVRDPLSCVVDCERNTEAAFWNAKCAAAGIGTTDKG